MLLPSKHPFVKMLVIDAHHNMKHGGVNDTLVVLRSIYIYILDSKGKTNSEIHCEAMHRLQET